MHGSIQVVKVLVLGFFLIVEIVGKHFTDLWAVHVKGGEEIAQAVAERHGFIYKGQIMPDYYHFQHRKVAKRSAYASTHYHQPLTEDSDILWVEQQVAKSRQKRSVINQRFNDPKWPLMWYLNRGGGLDMNVRKAWDMGYTGKGVVVTILDDGIEKDHPDLTKNYDANASFDVNGHDPDPQPRYDFSNENRHGTRCAGEVAAQADNNICSVGVAYNARIGGVRMLDGDVTDSVEAQSLSLNPQHIHIYSASWGPDDDGRTVDGPATLARKAFYDGITKGRGGLGSIFVWASGNGGRDFDNCNCDGYTNSIYTLSISSVTEKGDIPWYSEACSSTLATTYSSGSGVEKQIVTTDLRKSCTETHTGTSASAPLAAGLIALALEANPMLTWRDMQHIVIETSKSENLGTREDWASNGVGKNVSHSFGFGLMDAAAMVSLARNWTTVPAQHICEIRSYEHNSRPIPQNGRMSVNLYTDGCEGTQNHVKYLEHVQARITMTSIRRGETRIFLTSPSSTVSTLLARRTRDQSREGFNNWAFMTTHNWGEPAKGQWKLEIETSAVSIRNIKLRDWVLVLYGTDSPPRKSPTSVRSPHFDYGQYYPEKAPENRNLPPVDEYNVDSEEDYYENPPTTTTTTTTTTSNYFQRNHHFFQHTEKTNHHNIHASTSQPELKEWTLVMMGTSTHNMKRNHSQVGNNFSFLCAGVMSNGICIECKPGFFKMGETCLSDCPQHYYGYVQAVQLAGPNRSNYSKSVLHTHTQGVCKPCHESCLTCKGSMASDCFQCASGFEWRGNKQCEKKMIWDLLDPDVMKHLAWAIILCIAAILLFSVIFGILQARERGRLCWKSKPNYVPDWGKGHYDGVTPNFALHDSDNEAEFSPPAKTQTLFPASLGFKHHHCHTRVGQNV
ncbi:furin-1-like isoform X2 [Physella acuta]|uniref:furin-1-like isoform X2 n=1 Tax=Physella acuta TaxID=109671 RepID=UPI0027DADBAC|nr:furin-1-like isoform X2 [Physella acuta]